MVFKRHLDVCTPKGKRIIATVRQTKYNILVTIPFLEEVKRDKPEFAKNGVIKYQISKKPGDYEQSLKIMTDYLEHLFLKGMVKDDSTNTSAKKPTKPRRNEKPVTGGDSSED